MSDQLPDVAAFEALYASHGARMKSVACNMLGNRIDAEDAVQVPGLIGMLGMPPGFEPPAADPNAPSLIAALQEQLGLKLESARGPVEVAVFDRIEKPALD